MSGYVKPIIVSNEEISEGIFASSGDTNCYTMNVYRTQACDQFAVFRVQADHKTAQHISSKQIFSITFDQEITSVITDGYPSVISGNTVVITRELHGNAYNTHDEFNTGITVYCKDPMTISFVSYDISCTHSVNVQGKID